MLSYVGLRVYVINIYVYIFACRKKLGNETEEDLKERRQLLRKILTLMKSDGVQEPEILMSDEESLGAIVNETR